MFDAIIGNVQEKEMKRYGATNNEMVLYSYGIGCAYILFVIALSGELVRAFVFCIEVRMGYCIRQHSFISSILYNTPTRRSSVPPVISV